MSGNVFLQLRQGWIMRSLLNLRRPMSIMQCCGYWRLSCYFINKVHLMPNIGLLPWYCFEPVYIMPKQDNRMPEMFHERNCLFPVHAVPWRLCTKRGRSFCILHFPNQFTLRYQLPKVILFIFHKLSNKIKKKKNLIHFTFYFYTSLKNLFACYYYI